MKRRGFLQAVLSALATLLFPKRSAQGRALAEAPASKTAPTKAPPAAGEIVFTDDAGRSLVYLGTRTFNRVASYYKPSGQLDRIYYGKHSGLTLQSPLDGKFYSYGGDGGLGTSSGSSHCLVFDPNSPHSSLTHFYPPSGVPGKYHPYLGDCQHVFMRRNGEYWIIGGYTGGLLARVVKTFSISVPTTGATFDFTFDSADSAERYSLIGCPVVVFPSSPLPAGITVTGAVRSNGQYPAGRLTFTNSTGSTVDLSSRDYEIGSPAIEGRVGFPNQWNPPLVGMPRRASGIWRYTPGTQTWEQLSTYGGPWTGDAVEGHAAAYDRTRDVVWAVGADQRDRLWKFDPSYAPAGAGSWTYVPLNYSGSGMASGLLSDVARERQFYHAPTDEVIFYAKRGGAIVDAEFGTRNDALCAVKVTNGQVRVLKTPWVGPWMLFSGFSEVRWYPLQQHCLFVKDSTVIFTEGGFPPGYQNAIEVMNVTAIAPNKLTSPTPIFSDTNGFRVGNSVVTRGFANPRNNLSSGAVITGRTPTELTLATAALVNESGTASTKVHDSYYNGPLVNTGTDVGGFWWYNLNTDRSGHAPYPHDVAAYSGPSPAVIMLSYVMDDTVNDRIWMIPKDGHTPDRRDQPYLEFRWVSSDQPAWRIALAPYTLTNITPEYPAPGSTFGKSYRDHPDYALWQRRGTNAGLGQGIVEIQLNGWGGGVLATGVGTHGQLFQATNGHHYDTGTITGCFDLGTARWLRPLTTPNDWQVIASADEPVPGNSIFWDPTNLKGYRVFDSLVPDQRYPTAAVMPGDFVGNFHLGSGASEAGRTSGWSFSGWDNTTREKMDGQYKQNVGASARYGNYLYVPASGLSSDEASQEPAGVLHFMAGNYFHTFQTRTPYTYRVGLTTRKWIQRSTDSIARISWLSDWPMWDYCEAHKLGYGCAPDRDVIRVWNPQTRTHSTGNCSEGNLRAYPSASPVPNSNFQAIGRACITNGFAGGNLYLIPGVARASAGVPEQVIIVVDLDEMKETGSTTMYAIAPAESTNTYGGRGRKLLQGFRPFTGYQVRHFMWRRSKDQLLIFRPPRSESDAWITPADPYRGTAIQPPASTMQVVTIPTDWKKQAWACASPTITLGRNTTGFAMGNKKNNSIEGLTRELYKLIEWSDRLDCCVMVTGGSTPVQVITLD